MSWKRSEQDGNESDDANIEEELLGPGDDRQDDYWDEDDLLEEDEEQTLDTGAQDNGEAYDKTDQDQAQQYQEDGGGNHMIQHSEEIEQEECLHDSRRNELSHESIRQAEAVVSSTSMNNEPFDEEVEQEEAETSNMLDTHVPDDEYEEFTEEPPNEASTSKPTATATVNKIPTVYTGNAHAPFRSDLQKTAVHQQYNYRISGRNQRNPRPVRPQNNYRQQYNRNFQPPYNNNNRGNRFPNQRQRAPYQPRGGFTHRASVNNYEYMRPQVHSRPQRTAFNQHPMQEHPGMNQRRGLLPQPQHRPPIQQYFTNQGDREMHHKVVTQRPVVNGGFFNSQTSSSSPSVFVENRGPGAMADFHMDTGNPIQPQQTASFVTGRQSGDFSANSQRSVGQNHGGKSSNNAGDRSQNLPVVTQPRKGPLLKTPNENTEQVFGKSRSTQSFNPKKPVQPTIGEHERQKYKVSFDGRDGQDDGQTRIHKTHSTGKAKAKDTLNIDYYHGMKRDEDSRDRGSGKKTSPDSEYEKLLAEQKERRNEVKKQKEMKRLQLAAQAIEITKSSTAPMAPVAVEQQSEVSKGNPTSQTYQPENSATNWRPTVNNNLHVKQTEKDVSQAWFTQENQCEGIPSELPETGNTVASNQRVSSTAQTSISQKPAVPGNPLHKGYLSLERPASGSSQQSMSQSVMESHMVRVSVPPLLPNSQTVYIQEPKTSQTREITRTTSVHYPNSHVVHSRAVPTNVDTAYNQRIVLSTSAPIPQYAKLNHYSNPIAVQAEQGQASHNTDHSHMPIQQTGQRVLQQTGSEMQKSVQQLHQQMEHYQQPNQVQQQQGQVNQQLYQANLLDEESVQQQQPVQPVQHQFQQQPNFNQNQRRGPQRLVQQPGRQPPHQQPRAVRANNVVVVAGHEKVQQAGYGSKYNIHMDLRESGEVFHTSVNTGQVQPNMYSSPCEDENVHINKTAVTYQRPTATQAQQQHVGHIPTHSTQYSAAEPVYSQEVLSTPQQSYSVQQPMQTVVSKPAERPAPQRAHPMDVLTADADLDSRRYSESDHYIQHYNADFDEEPEDLDPNMQHSGDGLDNHQEETQEQRSQPVPAPRIHINPHHLTALNKSAEEKPVNKQASQKRTLNERFKSQMECATKYALHHEDSEVSSKQPRVVLPSTSRAHPAKSNISRTIVRSVTDSQTQVVKVEPRPTASSNIKPTVQQVKPRTATSQVRSATSQIRSTTSRVRSAAADQVNTAADEVNTVGQQVRRPAGQARSSYDHSSYDRSFTDHQVQSISDKSTSAPAVEGSPVKKVILKNKTDKTGLQCCQILNLSRSTGTTLVREMGEDVGRVNKVGRLKQKQEIMVITFFDEDTAAKFIDKYQHAVVDGHQIQVALINSTKK